MTSQSTYCNPLNIEYHLQAYEGGDARKPAAPERHWWREAADPVCTMFKGEYYLFASVSRAYWHSTDMIHWVQVKTSEIPLDYWEPNTFVIGDDLYYCHHRNAIYKSSAPGSGHWTKVRERLGRTDSEGYFMVDDDGRVYHVGLIPGEQELGFYMRELDAKNNLADVGEPRPCIDISEFHLVKEKPAEVLQALGETERWGYAATFARTNREARHIGKLTGEGAQLMKHDGCYFFQYANCTHSAFYGYRDFVFKSDSPWGPWEFQSHNPASYDPTGFCKGAGNSSVFQSADGEYWRVTTVNAAVVWCWERRIAIYPTGFDRDNVMYTDTYLGELPQYGPGKNPNPQRRNELGGNLVGWMLLSHAKPVRASSSLPDHPPAHAVEEEMTTWWAGAAGRDEWLVVDLEKPCRINAVQVNFAEQDVYQADAKRPHYHQYTLEVSDDGTSWRMLIDKSQNLKDIPHDYIELEQAVIARIARLTILHMPAGGRAAVRGLRLFGSGMAAPPEPVSDLWIERLEDDRYAKVAWSPAAGAEGYVVRYGVAPDKLYLAVDVRGATELPVEIPIWKPYRSRFPWKKNTFLGLTGGVDYYFAIDSFNDSGITRGTKIYPAKARQN